MAVTPTTITTEEQIFLVSSPVNLRIRNLSGNSQISSVVIELYVWNGSLNAPPTLPSFTLNGDKISKDDTYINFQISELIASYITGTKFAWSTGIGVPSISGEGVFFQYKYEVTNSTGVEAVIESSTNFATMGYRFDYEQIGRRDTQPYDGLIPISYNRKYTDKLIYYKRDFDFTKTLGACTSENIIASSINTPTNCYEQLGDKFLVAYINRLGLWDYFTTFGKAIKSTEISADTNARLYRDPNQINNNINHSKQRQTNDTPQSYVINTGELSELMIYQVEDVLFSPLIYLIEFTGAEWGAVDVALTVDSTIVTVDSTIITVDAITITIDDVGLYSAFKQIPVTCKNTNFVNKSRLNDKGKINYNLEFEATVGRINNLR